MKLGASLGPYRIDRELGSGGMGKVYAATGPDGVVALKVVHPHLLEQSGFFKRFLREADIGKSVRHDNVVRTLDCDAIGRHHYLVMEFVEGQTLSDLQRELEKVPEELCRHVAREICKGLTAIHDAGVVHRDLKPENVLITPDNIVKVMDLGVARLADEQLRLSQSGAFVGSVEYAAPEQFGGQVDHRCDLHALGLLLYEIACGQHPYRADSFPEVMRKVREDVPRRLGDVNPQLSAFFEEMVHTLLAKRAGDRFESAETLLAVLEAGESSEWWKDRAKALRTATKRPIRRIRIPRETAVYGREAELAQLRSLYDRAKSGDGQVVLIEGEAGIGKSRVIDELVTRLQADGEDLAFLFGSYPPGGAATASGAFSRAFAEQIGEDDPARYLPRTPLLVPAFTSLLHGDALPTGALPLDSSSMATCFLQATRTLAEERPTVLVVDDLHFAPDESRSLFAKLTQAISADAVLLIGTLRPGDHESWLVSISQSPHVTRMELGRLGAKDLGSLLLDAFGSVSLAEELGHRIAMKSDGNPYFTFEIIRGLREGSLITRRDDGTWTSTRAIERLEIPPSIREVVHARLAGVADEDRELLDAACCWGYEFDPTLVATALGMSPVQALRRLGHIERRERLVRSFGRQYRFDHHQVQETLYESLHEQLKEHGHAGLAEALETLEVRGRDLDQVEGELCVAVAHHFLLGNRGERCLPYLQRAVSYLVDQHVSEPILALTGRALAVPGLLAGADRATVILARSRPLRFMGAGREVLSSIEEARELALEQGDRLLAAAACDQEGWLHARESDHDGAEAAFTRAREFARAGGHPSAEAGALAGLASTLINLGRYDQARGYIERQIEIAQRIGDVDTESLGYGLLGRISFNLGRFEEVFSYAEREIALSRQIGQRVAECSAICKLAPTYVMLDRFGEALDAARRSLDLARRIGHRENECSALVNLGDALMAVGDVDECLERTEQALQLARELGSRSEIAIALYNRAAVRAELEDFDRAARDWHECHVIATEIGYRHLAVAAQLKRGMVLARRAADRDGEREVLAARDAAVEGRFEDQALLAECWLAARASGRDEDAVEAVRRGEERLAGAARREARLESLLLLWRAGGDRRHLAAAKRLLDEAVAKMPEVYRASACQNLRVNREILAAWREEFRDDDAAPCDTDPGESPTRAG